MSVTDPADDTLILTIGGVQYQGWTEFRATRGLDRCVADFEISVSERWAGQDPPQPWQILPFSPCTLALSRDLIMTGYVDEYEPSYDKQAHAVRVTGRSKTQDLTDCMPKLAGGQFTNSTLDAICRAVAQPFGIGVVVQTDMGEPFPDATLQRCETAFEFLERLCRLRGVLACDNENGDLVLTSAGSQPAAGALQQGQNILAATGKLDASRRFSKYIVRSQRPIVSPSDQVLTEIYAAATDTSVPRYRPHASVAESALDQAMAQRRANWQAAYAAGQGTEAKITVQGWRQADGTPWRVNQTVPVASDFLSLDQPLLIAGVTYSLAPSQGRRTELTLGPVAGYTPDPGEVKLRKSKGRGAFYNWSGAGGIS